MEIKKNKVLELISYILLGLIISPIIYIFLNTFKSKSEYHDLIFDNLYNEYVYNTLVITLGVLFLTLVIGISLAYFESFYEYRFRRFFKYTNLLTFSIPSYILGYIYVDIFTGPIYLFTNKYIDIANIKGAIILLSISFYPYVYIVMRGYFKKIPFELIENSKLLGKGNFETLKKIILPISRPAIVIASSLVIMETVNAFGLPNFFGIRVFSTIIYEAWVNYFDLNTAIKLSTIIICIIFVILFVEDRLRKNTKYEFCVSYRKIRRNTLSKKKEYILIGYLFFIFSISFMIPIIYIFRLFILSIEHIDYYKIIFLTRNTLSILIFSSISILFIASFISNIFRKKNNIFVDKLATIGYAIPSTVIAIGFLSLFLFIDNLLIDYNITNDFVLIKSPFIITLAYSTRFLSLAYNNIKTEIKKIGDKYHESSRLLGKGILKTYFYIDLPMQKIAVISSFLLVSIEIIKELPLASLLLIKNTLATQIKNYASDEEMVLIAPLSLILIFICFILILIYTYLEEKEEKNE